MTVQIGRRIALTVKIESLARKGHGPDEPPLGADDSELARWSARRPLDIEQARWNALALLHGGRSAN